MGLLEQIESNFGSVPEYNRVMAEEMEFDPYLGCYVERKYEEPSEEELKAQAKEDRIHNRKIEVLGGKPTDFAISLKKELDKTRPNRTDFVENTNDYYCACRKYSSKTTLYIIEQISGQYNVEFSTEVNPYNLPKDEWAIEIEHQDCGYVKHYAIRGLTYHEFKIIFTDLRYLGKNPVMFYGREGEHNTLILSNSSLGSIRYYYMPHYGLESRDDMDAEAIAINKAVYEANIEKARLYDGRCVRGIFNRCENFHYIGQIDKDDSNEYCYCDTNRSCSYEEHKKLGGAA